MRNFKTLCSSYHGILVFIQVDDQRDMESFKIKPGAKAINAGISVKLLKRNFIIYCFLLKLVL
jgi:hypothetical protein